MKATGINLGEVSDLMHTELAKYLGAPAWPRRRGLHQDAGHPRRRPPRTRPTGHQQVPDAHRTALRGTGLRNPDHRLRRKERDLPMTTGAARPSPQPREPISWTDLIAAGRRTLTPEPPAIQPTQAAVRRVGGAAYYAAFHALAASNADALTGTAHDPLTAGAWVRIYRGRAPGPAPPGPEQPLTPGPGLRPTLPQPPERAPRRRLQPAGCLHTSDGSQLAGQRRGHHYRLSPDQPVRTRPPRRTHPGQGALNARKPRCCTSRAGSPGEPEREARPKRSPGLHPPARTPLPANRPKGAPA